MTRAIRTLRAIVRNDGIAAGLSRTVDHCWSRFVRPRLPPKQPRPTPVPHRMTKHNGVLVENNDARWLDRWIGIPNYEPAYCAALRAVIDPGDSVTLVGGGRGVSTVVARRQSGTVPHVYECDPAAIEMMDHTLQRNISRAIIHHRRVTAGTPIQPADVLALDCEGDEVDIIDGLEYPFRTIVVEYHGHLGASEQAVRHALQNKGYTVTRHEPSAVSPTLGVLAADA